ncbi:MAG: asparaginase [Cytophagia bacterium]|nr:asparaginase [Cytophagia bacterium]
MKLNKTYINTALSGKARAKVLIIYTGGTFGMMRNEQGVLAPFDFTNILEHLPTLRNLALELTVISFDKPIDSSNIQPEHWQVMADIIEQHYLQYEGFVILHGTDTMAFSASALSFMLQGLNKPVIFTGAQLPISEPRSDARENLITALEIAAATIDGKPAVPEVCIFFDFELLRGNRSKKVESMQFDAFDSGNYPALAKAGVKIDYDRTVIQRTDDQPLRLIRDFDTQVAVLKLYPGLNLNTVRAVLNTPGLKGLIIETYGSGNAPTASWLLSEFSQAIQRGLIIVNVSQCSGGRVTQGKYETSKALAEIGVLGGADMTVEAALTKLMLLLGNYASNEVKDLIVKPLSGELTP